MSCHPNVILLLKLRPDGLARKTMREIAGDIPDAADVKIGSHDYHRLVMESDYNDNWQLTAKEGDLLFFDLVTYGYGESIAWDKLVAQARELEDWALAMCAEHHCSYEIEVTANYW
jgi:starvation-inducible outer membrane lipoprotein